MSVPSGIENVLVSGLENRKQTLVFVINVLRSNETCYQLTRRYTDFASFHRAIFLNQKLLQMPSLPSFQALLPQVQQQERSLLVPQLHLLTSYCKDLISSYPENPFILEFFQQSNFDSDMRRKSLMKSQTSQQDDFIPKGEGFPEFIVLNSFNGGGLVVQTGDLVIGFGDDAEGWSMVGRLVSEKLTCGWIPSTYLIPREDDPVVDDIHSYLLDIRALSDADQDRRLLRNVYYYKYTTTQRQEVIPTCSEPVILPEGTDVTVVDKDDDGWWYVSNHNTEGWFPSTVLEPREESVIPNPGDIDVVRIPVEGDPSTDQYWKKVLLYQAQTAYSGSSGDEVSFNQGESVEVLNKSASGWWTVRVKGKVGLCPAVFLSRQHGITRGTALGIYYKIGFNSSISKTFPPRRVKARNLPIGSPALSPVSSGNAQQPFTEVSQAQRIPPMLHIEEAAEDFSYTSCSPGRKLMSSTMKKLQESPKAIRKGLKMLKRSKLDLKTPPPLSLQNTNQIDELENLATAKMESTGKRKRRYSSILRVAVPLDLPRSLPGSPVNEQRKLFSEVSLSDGEYSPPMSPVEGFATAVMFPHQFSSAPSGGVGSPGHSLSKPTPGSEMGSGKQFFIPERFRHFRQKQASPLVADGIRTASPSSENKRAFHLQLANLPLRRYARVQAYSPELPRAVHAWDDDDDDDNNDNDSAFFPVSGKKSSKRLPQQIATISPGGSESPPAISPTRSNASSILTSVDSDDKGL